MKDINYQISEYGRSTIYIRKLNHILSFNEILKTIKMLERSGKIDYINLDFGGLYSSSYPNCIVPLSGIINYYNQDKKIKIRVINLKNKYLKNTSFHKVPIVTKREIKRNNESIFDKVWKFSNNAEIKLISDLLISEVQNKIICESGVISAMAWCVSEIMDNTLRHSKVNVGFFMCQLHEKTKRLVFSIYDHGIGLYNSLYPKYKPKSFTYAIELAMTQNVTSDDVDGQGFGLFGLQRMIKLNKGQLNITSRNAIYMYSNDHHKRDNYFENATYLSTSNCSTHVDFQLNYLEQISMKDVLPNGPYDLFQELIEELEDENGCYTIDIYNKTEGTSTRSSGAKIRILTLNIFNEVSGWILLDFKDINHMSSSFSDEYIGKIIIEIGESEFHNRFRIKNLKSELQVILSHTISARVKRD